MVALLLSQIYARAERLRVQSAPRAASPITLIELIEASYAVFERYDVGPPDDAEYHRYLLSLSIDPERDWQKKIQKFTLKDQPRIKRLCRFGNGTAARASGGGTGSTTAVLPDAVDRTDGGSSSRQGPRNMSNFYQHQSQQSLAISPRQRRHQPRPLNRDGGGVGSDFRKPSTAAAVEPVPAMMTPRAAPRASLPSFRAEPRPLRSPLSPASPQDHWKPPRRDQFSDMLALPPTGDHRRHSSSNSIGSRPQPLKENVTRNAEHPSPASRSPSPLSAKSERVGKNRFGRPSPDVFKRSPQRTPERPRASRSYNETTEELTLPEQYSREQDEDDSVEKAVSLINRQMQSANTHHQSHQLLVSRSNAKLRTLATAFENWKAIHAMNRITKQKKAHELRMRQAAMPPICTRALFRWVALTLPEVHAFETECQELPIAMLRRISTALNSEKLSTMRFFTQRLATWTLQRIFGQWRADTNKKRLFIAQVKRRRRAQVLETAFTCLQQWVMYKEMRQCLHEKSAWVTQRHDRGSLRACLEHWRECLYLAQSLTGATRHHERRMLRSAFADWKQSLKMNQRVLQLYTISAKRRVVAQWKHGEIKPSGCTNST
ncbi:hypothetical protein Gpo141_00006998 [Globisporangium polare]